jgi:hypothetical protein
VTLQDKDRCVLTRSSFKPIIHLYTRRPCLTCLFSLMEDMLQSVNNSSMEYVPMIWTGNTTSPDAQGGDRELYRDLNRIAQNIPTLLGFNEPDNSKQANISSSDVRVPMRSA